MDASTPMPRSIPHPDGPHAPMCTVLSVGTPTLIAAALRAGRRGADPAALAHLRVSLAARAYRDPAAALVVAWLDARLGHAASEAGLGSPPPTLAETEAGGETEDGGTASQKQASGSTTDLCACPSLAHEVRS